MDIIVVPNFNLVDEFSLFLYKVDKYLTVFEYAVETGTIMQAAPIFLL